MGFRRTSLVLYILFIFYLQHSLIFVSSCPHSADTSHESVPFSASESDVVGCEGKTRELAVVMKTGSCGGRGGSKGGGRGGSKGGGGGGPSRLRGGGGVLHPIRSSNPDCSSGSMSHREEVCTVGRLGLSVLAGLLLV